MPRENDTACGSQKFRPPLPPVKNSNYFCAAFVNAIEQDVGRIWDDKFAGASDTSGPTQVRVQRETLHAEKNLRSHTFRRGGIVQSNIGADSNQMLNCAGRPEDLHRGGLRSVFLPQDCSHLLTFACSTPLPASNSLIPA